MINAVFEQEPRFLLINELEHISITNHAVLLSLMQNDRVSESEVKKTRETLLERLVFAT